MCIYLNIYIYIHFLFLSDYISYNTKWCGECQELVSLTSMRSRGIFLNEKCSEFADAHRTPKEKMAANRSNQEEFAGWAKYHKMTHVCIILISI